MSDVSPQAKEAQATPANQTTLASGTAKAAGWTQVAGRSAAFTAGTAATFRGAC
ncbi:MAG: hypothetical protein ABSC72_11070 [Methylovirgula sp.]|jgi:hypothetical protein